MQFQIRANLNPDFLTYDKLLIADYVLVYTSIIFVNFGLMANISRFFSLQIYF